MYKLIAGLLLINCVLFVETCYAEFAMKIGDGSPMIFTAGDKATIPVYAYNSVPDARIDLDGFDLAFDLGGDGIGIPGTPDFFSDFEVDFVGSSFGQTINSYLDTRPYVPNNYDFIVGNSGGPFTLPSSSSPTKLFDIIFSISALTTGGVYGFVFIPNATTNGVPLNAISGTGVASVNLSSIEGTNFNEFTVTAVPEPSSLVPAIILSGSALLWRFRYRRRSVMPVSPNKLSSDQADIA